MKRVSIQGIKGCFHEEAARKYFVENIQPIECNTFEEVIASVENHHADAGIMAIENTVSGTIHKNFDLIRGSKLTITGEIYSRIVQNLAVNKGVKIQNLTHVESHYMAINQCRNFFKSYPNIQLVDAMDTAASMRHVASNNLISTGAIGSSLAANYYNLEIIKSGIETDKENYTRFLIVEKNAIDCEANKSSVQLILANKVGGLVDVLQILKENNINLTKIESLPIVGEPWHYQFYLDMLYEERTDFIKALNELKPQLENISILGNYINQNQLINI